MNERETTVKRTTRTLQATAALMLALTCALVAQAPPRSPTASADALKLPFETYTLPNGLTVILSQDKTTPTVAVNVWYKVGSKNELVGRTGFAHLFEHVMFTGSGNVPYGLHDKLTEGVGGSNNGTTNNDRTTYYETVPTNYLESALWLEADRMGYLLDSLDLAKLNAQRDIVKNERRQSVDNQPYGRAGEILAKATYPASAPVFVGRHRQHGGSLRRLGRGRQELLPALLRAEQRLPLDRRRLRSGAGQGVGDEVLRRHPARQADHAPKVEPVTLAGGEAARLRGPRAGAAALHPVADGGRDAATIASRSTCSAPS